MAKLSHDDQSWHASGLQARDARHTKGPDDERPVGQPRKKDTKRWCKGKEGREHEIVWVPFEVACRIRTNKYASGRVVGRCKNCYKEMCSGPGTIFKKNGVMPMCEKHKVRHPKGV